MGLNHSPRIITDGLVLCLDAGNPKSYPGSGTAWNDLSGNRNSGTLTNGPTYSSSNGGTIVLDGSNDFISVANNSTLNSTIGTVSLWFKYTSMTGSGSFIGKHDASGSFFGYHIFYDAGTSKIGAQIKNATAPETTDVTQASISSNNWYNVVLTYSSGSSHAFYLNGSTISTGSCVMFTMSSQALRIGDSVDTFWGIWAGSLGAVQIYNSVLNAEQVNINFNALRGRYGI